MYQPSILIDQDKIFLELGYVQGAILEPIPFVHLDRPQPHSDCLFAEDHHQDRAAPFRHIHSSPDFLIFGEDGFGGVEDCGSEVPVEGEVAAVVGGGLEYLGDGSEGVLRGLFSEGVVHMV